ncbi:hypothetical protein [uncultured Limosilactobacillus sp.]|uniref:hypothetical protein n=1 Tax=uncultured Limosilactobacillus sp. TaxID=2837629 RepID=UPI0025D2B7EE|nr:hypothetical protein [uncultured Limosilactobacillus sp.]
MDIDKTNLQIAKALNVNEKPKAVFASVSTDGMGGPTLISGSPKVIMAMISAAIVDDEDLAKMFLWIKENVTHVIEQKYDIKAPSADTYDKLNQLGDALKDLLGGANND